MNQPKRNSLELARHLMVSVLSALIAVGPAPLAFAGPVPKVKNDPRITNSGEVWDITYHNGDIIKYRTFDVGGSETVNFIPVTGGKDARVLNRIDGVHPSQIDGTISGVGHIYIVNPAGIFFGADANINVTVLQAAAGNISDRDFERKIDHFTDLKGKVENAAGSGADESAGIFANAVSLVGRNVVNSGTIATDGWIVMAAGRDVFIGRDGNGNGLLLRVEGGADAVFNKSAKGVTNTGDLTASDWTGEDGKTKPGRISLGAGDLYGTAIFNRGAIHAREIALQASNKGNVALGGDVKADTLGITFAGDKAGKLVSAGGPIPIVSANTLNLTATGAKGQVVVGDRIDLERATPADADHPTTSVNVEQKAILSTSNLAKLDIDAAGARANTLVNLNSTAGVIIDDRALVTGTRLTVESPATAITGSSDPLQVEQLDMESRFVQTQADLIAKGEDGSHSEQDPNDSTQQIEVLDPVMRFSGNLQIVTKKGSAGDAGAGTLISAKNGTLSTAGDITTSDGGGLRIEAGDVRLGILNSDGTLTGGSIVNSGARAARVTITADNRGLAPHLRGSVQANEINTRAGVVVPGVDQAVGGDVTVSAFADIPPASEIPKGSDAKDYGDVTLFGDILTQGGSSPVKGNPQHDGGRVQLLAGQTLTVQNVITGGGAKPSGVAEENGSIALTAPNVVLAGSLDANASSVKNERGSRNRSVTIDAGQVTLGADLVKITGGTVVVGGPIVEGTKPNPAYPGDPTTPPTLTRDVALSFDTNRLLLSDGAKVDSLDIVARDAVDPNSPDAGSGVLFGGDVIAQKFVHVLFDTAAGVVRWGTPAGETVTVSAPEITVTANHPVDSLVAGGAKVAFDPTLDFALPVPSNDPNAPSPQFSLWQSGAIDKATTDSLLGGGRFGVDGLSGRTLSLRTNSGMTFDQSALDNVKNTDLKLIADLFTFDPALSGTPTFDVASLELTTFGNLNADFDVTAHGKGLTLHSGATGVGNLSVSGNLRGSSIQLIAGDGTNTADGGATGASIIVADSARFLSNTSDTVAPEVFGIQQDASISTDADHLLPSNSQFGGSIAGMEYRLESADGDVRLAPGAAAKLAGTNLLLNGQTSVDVGSEPLTLAGLAAQTRGNMTVATPITVSGQNGVIDLSAGEGGSGRLTVNAKLTADNIDLRAAGVGDAATGSSSSIVLGDAARFAGGTSTLPTHFGMVQDATLDQTQMPTLADFDGVGPNGLAGMDFELRALGGQLSLSDPSLVAGTALKLEGRDGVVIDGDLLLQSLDAKGPLSTNRGITTTVGDLSIDTTVNLIQRGVTLNGTSAGSSSVNQSLVSAGALTITGKVSKTTAGDVALASADGHALTVGDVATAHTGGHIDISSGADATIGALDASGTGLTNDSANPVVQVSGKGTVEIASISAHGKNGGTVNTNGTNGGNVEVTGGALRLGTVDTSGGNGGFATPQADTFGGDAGAIELGGPNGTPIEVSILGDLLADGGVGARSVLSTLPLQRGQTNDVHVGGSLLLVAKNADGPTNAITGRNVKIDGAVGTGKEKPDANGVVADIDPDGTGLRVVADDSLVIGGNSITAGNLDLEVHKGDLDLGTKTIHSNTIRLAATDGAGHVRDGEDNAVVNVDQLTFLGAVTASDPLQQLRILSLTLEQDKGFGGPAGSPIPDVNHFGGIAGENYPPVALSLISQDGTIAVGSADLPRIAGTKLTLAANRPADPNAPAPIQIDVGQDLSLAYLQLGSALGVGGGVGGDTKLTGNVTVGGNGESNDALRTYGNLTVTGDATVDGTARFAGTGNQLLHVDGVLDLAGTDTAKSTNGLLRIEAGGGIVLSSPTAQTISNDGGRLEIDGALIKGDFSSVDANGDGNLDPNPEYRDANDPNTIAVGTRGLSLSGVSDNASDAAVVVTGTRPLNNDPTLPDQRTYAIAVANGDLSISASQSTAGSSTTSVGKYELGGDVLAFGDIVLAGEGSFVGQKPKYTVEAARNQFALAGDVLSGELTMGGIAKADGNLTLIARGDDPSLDVPHPTAIHMRGNFQQLAGDLEVDGSLDFADDTTISAAGDVRFDGVIQGEKSLSVSSKGQVVLFDDVALTAGALSLSGDSGVQFASTSDTQSIQAGSISLGSGATLTPTGSATLVRDGNLSLSALGGDVSIGNGQRMVVNGSLSMSAKRNISITDTAALKIKLVSQDLIVRAGSTVMANSIASSAAPRVTSGGVATFAVPTRTEVSSNIPSDEILLRQINGNGAPLSLASSFPPDVEFPIVPFPDVSGPAQFDYARQTPLPPLRQSLTRPHVDAKELDAALVNRPLWAEELLAYLEQRSVETPGVAEAVEHLPPVGARPGDPLESEDRRVRSAAAERAVALYRELFRPDVARNPETGFIDEPARAAAIRTAFQQPIDVLRRGNRGQPVSGDALRELIASNPTFAPAQAYTAQLGQLVAAGELALTPDQKPRFSVLLLSDVIPYGIAPTEFATALR